MAALRGDGKSALNVLCVGGGAEMACWQHVEAVLGLVHGTVDKGEDDTGGEGDDGDSAVIPDETGVLGEGSKGLGEGGGEGGGEELDGLDERTHVLGGLGEGVLEGGDGGEDLGDGNQDVDTGNGPHVDVGAVIVTGVVVDIGVLVDEVLENGGPDHGKGTDNETSGNLLDGSESDTLLEEEWVDDEIHD